MAFNPANGGALDVITDSENPRSFSGRAREVISGGQFVVVSGAANVVGSTLSSFSPGSVIVTLLVDSDHANGIAMHNAGSNEIISFATRGRWLATAADAISGGVGLYPIQATVQGVGVVPNGISYSGTQIGRSVTASASGTNNWLIADFNF